MIPSTTGHPFTHIRPAPQFSGHGAGRIQALHCQGNKPEDLEAATQLFQAVKPHGIDVYVHGLYPKNEDYITEDELDIPQHIGFKLEQGEAGSVQLRPVKSDPLPSWLSNLPPGQPLTPDALKQTPHFNKLYRLFKWLQDYLCFDQDKVRMSRNLGATHAIPYSNFIREAGLKPVHGNIDFQWGNHFLIRKPNGEQVLLIGEADFKKARDQYRMGKAPLFSLDREKLRINYAKTLLGGSLGIKPENIHVLPQPEYHLDLMVVPLTYPKILVQDFVLSHQVLEEVVNQLRQKGDYETLSRIQQVQGLTHHYQKELKRMGYADTEQTIQALTKMGFEPIRAPLVYGYLDTRSPSRGGPTADEDIINVANAHVHQRDDGKLVYIAMRSSIPVLNSAIEKALRKVVPDLAETVLTTGGKIRNGEEGDRTYYEQRLITEYAGLHCIFAEQMAPFQATA